MGGGADERVASEASPQEACLVHRESGEGDRLLGGLLRGGDHRKAAHPRRLDPLPLGGATIPPAMTPIDGSSYTHNRETSGDALLNQLWHSRKSPSHVF